MQRLAAGYVLPEALRASGSLLYFSDAAAGGVFALDAGSVNTVVPKRRGVGGLALHRDGGIVITGRDLIHVRNGESRTIFTAAGAMGLNDLTTDATGAVLVGSLRMDWRDPSSGAPGEIFRVTSVGSAEIVVGQIDYPNGVGLGPNEEQLYVADFVGRQIHCFEMEAGQVVSRSVLVDIPHGNPDGLALDVEGGVWVATGEGGTVERYDATGKLTEVFEPPTNFAVTLCFGGADGRDLYIATADSTDREDFGGSIHLVRAPVAGATIGAAIV
jgi:sugar lactone lactonase YvrE